MREAGRAEQRPGAHAPRGRRRRAARRAARRASPRRRLGERSRSPSGPRRSGRTASSSRAAGSRRRSRRSALLAPTISSVPPTSSTSSPRGRASSVGERASAPSTSSTSTIRTCCEPAAARQHGQRDLAAGPGLDVGRRSRPRAPAQRRDGADRRGGSAAAAAAAIAAAERYCSLSGSTSRCSVGERVLGDQRDRVVLGRALVASRGAAGRGGDDDEPDAAPPRRRRSRTRRSAPWWSSRSTPTPRPPGGVRRRSWRPPSSGRSARRACSVRSATRASGADGARRGRGRLLRRRRRAAQRLQPPGHRIALGRNGVGRRGRRPGFGDTARGFGGAGRGFAGAEAPGPRRRTTPRPGRDPCPPPAEAAARLATPQLLEALSRTLDPFPRHGAFIPPAPPAPAGAGRSR